MRVWAAMARWVWVAGVGLCVVVVPSCSDPSTESAEMTWSQMTPSQRASVCGQWLDFGSGQRRDLVATMWSQHEIDPSVTEQDVLAMFRVLNRECGVSAGTTPSTP